LADVNLRIVLDNIVEDIHPYLNNFIQLRKNPSRQYRSEETNLSKLEGKKVSVKNPAWEKS